MSNKSRAKAAMMMILGSVSTEEYPAYTCEASWYEVNTSSPSPITSPMMIARQEKNLFFIFY